MHKMDQVRGKECLPPGASSLTLALTRHVLSGGVDAGEGASGLHDVVRARIAPLDVSGVHLAEHLVFRSFRFGFGNRYNKGAHDMVSVCVLL